MTALGLVACSNKLHSDPAVSGNNKMFQYTNEDVGYALSVPKEFSFRTDDDEGMYFGYPESLPTGHFFIQIFDRPTDSKQLTNCKGTEIGVYHPIIDENGERVRMVWGKVDYHPLDPPEPHPLCQSAFGSTVGSYELCSIKDEKQVIICINQKTDNYEFAKKILDTFQWIK